MPVLALSRAPIPLRPDNLKLHIPQCPMGVRLLALRLVALFVGSKVPQSTLEMAT